MKSIKLVILSMIVMSTANAERVCVEKLYSNTYYTEIVCYSIAPTPTPQALIAIAEPAVSKAGVQ